MSSGNTLSRLLISPWGEKLKELTDDLWRGDERAMRALLKERSIATLHVLVSLKKAAKELGESYRRIHQTILDEKAKRDSSKSQAGTGESYTIKRGTFYSMVNPLKASFFRLNAKPGLRKDVPFPKIPGLPSCKVSEEDPG